MDRLSQRGRGGSVQRRCGKHTAHRAPSGGRSTERPKRMHTTRLHLELRRKTARQRQRRCGNLRPAVPAACTVLHSHFFGAIYSETLC